MEKNRNSFNFEEATKFIKNGFSDFYGRRCCYSNISEYPIVAKEDETVIFTGATITPFMPRLISGTEYPELFLIQPCLRTNNINSAYDENHIPEYMSYFTMCGTLSPPKKKDETINDAYNLLTDVYKIIPEDIIVRSSSRDKDLTNDLKEKVLVEENTKPNSYYDWKYGREEISGRGITFAVRGGEGIDYRDIGNIVAIEKSGSISGYEFGFGVETLLSRIYGLTRPVEAARISQIITFEPGINEKFSDLLVASIVMFQNGVIPGTGKEKHVLKTYLKALSYWQRNLNIPINQIKNWADVFSKNEFGETGENGEKIKIYLEKYNQKINEYKDYINNQLHAWQIKGIKNPETLKNHLFEKAGYFQLNSIDAKNIINNLLNQ